MENTPSRIAADILITAIETKQIYVESAAEITTAFNEIHAAVHAAAAKDRAHNLFLANS